MVSANIHSDWLTASGFAMPMSWMAGASTSSEALMASIPVETFRKLTEPVNFESAQPAAVNPANAKAALPKSGSVTFPIIRHAPATAMSASAIRKIPAPSLHPAEPNSPSASIAPLNPVSTAAAFPS